MCVVARHTKAGTWVDREGVADLDRALHLGGDFVENLSCSACNLIVITTYHDLCPPHRFDDEYDRYQAGKALLCEPGDVANKEAAKMSRNDEKSLKVANFSHLASVATKMMSIVASQSPIQIRKERYSQPKPTQN